MLSRQGTRSTFSVPAETLVVEAQLELGGGDGDGDGDAVLPRRSRAPLGAPLLDEHKAAFERQRKREERSAAGTAARSTSSRRRARRRRRSMAREQRPPPPRRRRDSLECSVLEKRARRRAEPIGAGAASRRRRQQAGAAVGRGGELQRMGDFKLPRDHRQSRRPLEEIMSARVSGRASLRCGIPSRAPTVAIDAEDIEPAVQSRRAPAASTPRRSSSEA